MSTIGFQRNAATPALRTHERQCINGDLARHLGAANDGRCAQHDQAVLCANTGRSPKTATSDKAAIAKMTASAATAP